MNYSVIIPVYQSETTIEQTVASIQACGLRDFEIVLVDDGSTDASPAICDALAEKWPNIRAFHQPNAGVSAARNRGLSEAQGDYVWFFDSDDIVDPGSMVDAMHVIEEHAPDCLIFGMSFDYYHDGQLFRREELVYEKETRFSFETLSSEYRSLYACNALTAIWNKLVRREMLLKNGLRFSERMIIMEDFYYVTQLLPHCTSIYTLPQVIYRYRNDGDRVYARLSKIERLAEYIRPFERTLAQQPKVLAELYFMLLNQKLYRLPLREIETTAQDYCASIYITQLAEYCPRYMDKITLWLRRKAYFRIWLHYRVRNIRNHAVAFVKRTRVYQKIRGRTK